MARDATLKEIKLAYRALARKWHPDRAGDSPEVLARWMLIVEAYEVLGEEPLRQRFDSGEDISKTARKKRADSFNGEFSYRKDDVREDGTVNAWYTDPETGEKEFVDIKVHKTEEEKRAELPRPQMPPHCCLDF